MLNFSKWLESLHSYDDPDNEKLQPLKANDTFRVFHGFYSFQDAYRAAIYGLTGREFADRRYSYESDNNPYGLFVTLSLKKAAYFVSGVSDQVIMEFIANEVDLESPVWPGGSYTVQGQMAQYFGHGRKGKLARNQRKKDAEEDTNKFLQKYPNDFQHVRQSDKKYKANVLLNSTEYQALFVGDLNPKDIAAFHVKAKGSRYDMPFDRLTREQFLQKYNDYKDEPPEWNKFNWNYPPDNRVFQPNEEFDGNKFLQGMAKRYSHDEIDKILSSVWNMVAVRKDKKNRFMDLFKNFLWPKQYSKAMLFMKNRYGKGKE